MNDYSDETLTQADLNQPSPETGLFFGDEKGSTFTNCTFTGDWIERIDFSYASFTNCTFNCKFMDCKFLSAEGVGMLDCHIVFDTAPPVKWLPEDSINTLFQGDGVKTEFDFSRVDETEVRNAIENTPYNDNGDCYSSDDYTLTMGIIKNDCNFGSGPVSRTEWLADTHYEISTDATDSYSPYDGIPDITADGISSCTITITKKKNDGTTDTSDDTTVVTFLTTRGSLDSLQETMTNGVATVTLTSVAETTIATVTAQIEGEEDLTIDIQFAPGS